MDKKLEFIFGILFVMIMVGAVEGSGFDWATYGGELQPFTQSQFPSAYGNFSSSVNTLLLNMSNGIVFDSSANAFTPYQSVISDLNGTQEYIVIQNGNYVQIYNQNLALFQEIFTGSGLSQLSVTDFDHDGNTNDIAGVWEINDTSWYFGVFTFNSTSFSLSQTFQKNYSGVVSKKIAGVRCSGVNCYFVNAGTNVSATYNSTFEWINSSTSNSFLLPITSNISNEYYQEPPSYTDVDGDGSLEFLTFSKHNVVLFRQDGTNLWTYNTSTTLYDFILGAKIFHPDATNVWKIAILEGHGASGEASHNHMIVKRPDGTNLYTKTFTYGISENYVTGALAISNDYDGDNLNDIYVLGYNDAFTSIFDSDIQINVLRGNDGTVLANRNMSDLGWNVGHNTLHNFGLTIANLNSGSRDDLIMSYANHIIAFDISNNQTIFYFNTSQTKYGCVPADLYLRGSLDIVCSGINGTEVFYTNFTNQNAVINSVSYNPDILIPVNSQVDAFISASDPENNVIVFRHSCFNGDVFSADSFSSTQSCYYSAVGTYNMTVQAHDTYHLGDWVSFFQLITVTQTGSFCNNNGSCDASLGENTNNCPNDCPATPDTQQSGETGGSSLPTQIVDVNNMNQGLLPEVYFGTLGFLSNTIQPMIILIFMIFFVLIILTIAFIIKKVGNKVSDLAG